MNDIVPIKTTDAPPQQRALPSGWRWVLLGEVCEINPRRSDITRRDMEPTSFVPMEAVDAGMGVISEIRERPFADVKKGYTYFEDGDVLFAKITPCMQNGKHAIARNLIEGIGFASTEFHVIRPANGILADWLHFFVRQPAILHDATNHFTGAVGQQRVPDDYLRSLQIPLPAIEEQQRIAGVLREQMATVEKAHTAAQARLAAVKALPAAFLRQVFPQLGQPLPAGWRWIRLGEVCEIKGGKRLPNGTDYIEGNTQFPYIRVVDFSEGTVNPHNLKYIDAATQSKISRYIISRHDVYISIAGTIGLVGTIPDSLDGANLTENAARLLIKDKDVLHRDYLARLLMSGMGKEFIHERTNTVGQPKLALTRIATIPVPLPPLTEQKRIAALLNKQMAAAQKVRAAAEEELSTINALPAALLRRAFNGEL